MGLVDLHMGGGRGGGAHSAVRGRRTCMGACAHLHVDGRAWVCAGAEVCAGLRSTSGRARVASKRVHAPGVGWSVFWW